MRVLCIVIIALIWVPFAFAKETFYSALESKESVENEGGQVVGGNFAPGQNGNGFISANAGDVIHFPVENRILNLKEGTVECWVKMGFDVPAADKWIVDEFYMFSTYKLWTDAIFLQFDRRASELPNGPGARMRIKSAGKWFNANSGSLEWKTDEIHHIAGTWGPDGLKLYLDGELAGSTSDIKDGPAVFADTFEINNNSWGDLSDPKSSHTNCVVDELRISDNQKSANELMIDIPSFVQPDKKIAATWGELKNIR